MKINLIGEPISTNGLYATMCRGNFPSRYMTKRGKDLKEDYQWQVKSQYKGKPMTGLIGMMVSLYFGNKRKNDIDNFNKIVYDALTGLVWVDDSQIEWVRTQKYYDKENPRVELEIYDQKK